MWFSVIYGAILLSHQLNQVLYQELPLRGRHPQDPGELPLPAQLRLGPESEERGGVPSRQAGVRHGVDRQDGELGQPGLDQVLVCQAGREPVNEKVVSYQIIKYGRTFWGRRCRFK